MVGWCVGWTALRQGGGTGWAIAAHHSNPVVLNRNAPTLIGHFVLFSTSLDRRNPQRRKPNVGNLSATGASRIGAPTRHVLWKASLAVVFCVSPSKDAGGIVAVLCSTREHMVRAAVLRFRFIWLAICRRLSHCEVPGTGREPRSAVWMRRCSSECLGFN